MCLLIFSFTYLLPVFVNKVLLEDSHTHLLMCCPWLLVAKLSSYDRDHVAYKPCGIYSAPVDRSTSLRSLELCVQESHSALGLEPCLPALLGEGKGAVTGGTARTQAALATSSGVLLTVPLGGEFRSFLKCKCDHLYPSISLLAP